MEIQKTAKITEGTLTNYILTRRVPKHRMYFTHLGGPRWGILMPDVNLRCVCGGGGGGGGVIQTKIFKTNKTYPHAKELS